MFKNRLCSSCGKKVKDEFDFCPYCGEELESEEIRMTTPFGGMFENIDKEFERIDKTFGFGQFKLPIFKIKTDSRTGGISIIVQSGTGVRPKIQVKTSGEYKKIEPEIKRKLGVGPEIEEVEEVEEYRRVPKVTEEPETKTQNIGGKQIISIKLPSIKHESDIEVKRLEQSIEVKAFAGDKAYFKLVPVHKEASIGKEFKNGVLKLEIEK